MAVRRNGEAEQLWRELWRRREITNVVIGLSRIGLFVFWLAPITGAIEVDERRTAMLAAGIYTVVAGATVWALSRRWFRPVRTVLAAPKEATSGDRRAVLRLPLRVAAATAASWCGAGLVGFFVYRGFDDSTQRAVLVGIGVSLVGTHVAAFVYLQVERALRPAFVAALLGRAPHRPATLRLRERLVLGWALGSGASLLSAAVMLAWSPGNAGERPVWPLIGLAVIEGIILTRWTARSITEPIEQVCDGLARIERGDLSTELDVDDGSELGRLQVGFNRMVDALRDRERLSDLFDRQVGNHAAQVAVSRGTDFTGEEVDASMLFVDLVDSSGLAETSPLSEVQATLNALFEAVVHAVAAEGGWVNKFVGDAVVCVFGGPEGVRDPDHAGAALRAARRISDDLADLRTVLPALDAGVGVATGRVVAAHLGSTIRYEYTVIGAPVNIASRLCDLAKRRPGRVLAAASTVVEAAGSARIGSWSPLGPVTVRGREGPIEAYEPSHDVIELPSDLPEVHAAGANRATSVGRGMLHR